MREQRALTSGWHFFTAGGSLKAGWRTISASYPRHAGSRLAVPASSFPSGWAALIRRRRRGHGRICNRRSRSGMSAQAAARDDRTNKTSRLRRLLPRFRQTAICGNSAANSVETLLTLRGNRREPPREHLSLEPRTARLQIYLPIADLPVNVFVILAMELAVGFISGMFGIGGGFLMTPLLIFLGISPAVAVASVTSHIAASSMSGAISYWRRRAIDLALACMLLAGGIIGTAFGVWLFTLLRALGQLDLTIGVSYVLLLGIVGALMVAESVRAIIRARQGKPAELRRPGSHIWIHGLPFKVRFKRSRIYVSAIPVWGIGFLIGFIGAVMGIGGGFILVPLLIYLLRVPTATVIGTSMLLTLITMASATVMHAATNHLV